MLQANVLSVMRPFLVLRRDQYVLTDFVESVSPMMTVHHLLLAHPILSALLLNSSASTPKIVPSMKFALLAISVLNVWLLVTAHSMRTVILHCIVLITVAYTNLLTYVPPTSAMILLLSVTQMMEVVKFVLMMGTVLKVSAQYQIVIQEGEWKMRMLVRVPL